MLTVVISLALLFIIFFFSFFHLNFEKIRFKTIFLTVCLFNLTFLFIRFLSSNDLYSYIFTGRVFSIFGQNPYITPYSYLAFDPLYPKLETIWAHQTVL